MVNFLGGDYPNPAKDYVVIGNISFNEKLISATIINSIGKAVAQEAVKNNTFDVSKISQGVYFVRLLHSTGRYASARLVFIR